MRCRRSLATRAVAAALVLPAALAAGCGGDDEGGPAAGPRAGADPKPSQQAISQAKPIGIERAGSYAQLADCTDWRKADVEQRYASVAELRDALNNQRSKTAGSPLRDERAYQVFQEACEPEWAGSLRLYKLYYKIQGWAPLSGG